MKKVLRKSNLVAGILILIVVCLGIVFAGDVIVKQGDLDVSGSAILGDATTDYHAINVNPDSDSMLTAEFSNTQANSDHYFFEGKFTDSGDTDSGEEKHSYGYYLDMDVSGYSENDEEETEAYGIYIDLDDTSDVDDDAAHCTTGIYSNVHFGGTNTDALDLYMYGAEIRAIGNLGYTGGTKHYGLRAFAYNTADNNYGIYSMASGATTNYAGYFNGDVHIQGDLTVSGSGPWSRAADYGTTDMELLKKLEANDTNDLPTEFYRIVPVEEMDETGEMVVVGEATAWNVGEIIKLMQGAILELKKENETLKAQIARIKTEIGIE